jgi:hypothetical protein
MLNAPVLTKKVFGIDAVMDVVLVMGSDVVQPGTPVGFPKVTGVQLSPFTVTTDCETNPVPFTMTESEDDTLLTRTPDGEIDVTVGVGLCDGVTVRVCGRLVPPPGGPVITVTKIVPGPWMSSARMVAVS